MPNVMRAGYATAARVVAVGAASALLCLTGCSPDEPAAAPAAESTAPSSQVSDSPAASPSPRPTASRSPEADRTEPAERADAICTWLTPAEAATLAGGKLPEPKAQMTGGLSWCHWSASGGARVLVAGGPAGTWARQLPAIVDQVKASGALDQASLRKLEDARDLIASGKEIAPDRACGLFSSLLEIQGLPSGSSRIVNLYPTRSKPRAINGQACSQGRYTSVQLVAPDLTGSDAEAERVSNALTEAHKRNAG